MSWKLMRFRDFLKRSKIPIEIQDNELYKRVTIKIKHNGVSLRDEEVGKQIGTKKQFILKSGQFILSKIDARYGAFGIAPEEVDGAIITGNFWAYDVDFSLVNIDWFNQFTNSQDFYDLCERASSGITHRKYLNEDSFLDNEIYLPSPEEQLQIIEEFKTNRESINILSTELTHQLDLVKQLRQAFLREAMQGKLVPQDPNDKPASLLLEKIKAEKERLIKEKKIKKQKPLLPITEEEIPFEIPESWVWCRLGDLCEIRGGKRVPVGYKLSRKETPYIYIRVSDMQNGTIIDSDLHYIEKHIYQKIKNYTISKDDIYMTIVGATIGKCGLVPSRFDGCNLTENAVKIEPYHISKEFLWQLLQMPFAQAQFIDKTKKVGVEKMAIFRFRSTILPLPPLSEQQRIFAKLDELMGYCDELEASIKESQQQNELLLQQVLREALELEEKEVEKV